LVQTRDEITDFARDLRHGGTPGRVNGGCANADDQAREPARCNVGHNAPHGARTNVASCCNVAAQSDVASRCNDRSRPETVGPQVAEVDTTAAATYFNRELPRQDRQVRFFMDTWHEGSFRSGRHVRKKCRLLSPFSQGERSKIAKFGDQEGQTAIGTGREGGIII
jgi:hypothetical protein